MVYLHICIFVLRHIGLLETDEDKIRKIRPKGTLVTILYVPREVDLADKTRGAQRPESCPPGQPPEGHIASLGTYRIVNRVPAGRILSTGRALGRDLCDKDFVLVRLQQANM